MVAGAEEADDAEEAETTETTDAISKECRKEVSEGSSWKNSKKVRFTRAPPSFKCGRTLQFFPRVAYSPYGFCGPAKNPKKTFSVFSDFVFFGLFLFFSSTLKHGRRPPD